MADVEDFDTLQAEVHRFTQAWAWYPQDGESCIELGKTRFGLPPVIYDVAAVKAAYDREVLKYRALVDRLAAARAAAADDDGDRLETIASLRGGLQRCLEFVYYLRETIESDCRARLFANPTSALSAPSTVKGSEMRFSSQTDDAKLTAVQEAVLFVLDRAQRGGYRRYKGGVWAPRYGDCVAAEGQAPSRGCPAGRRPTRAWRMVHDTMEAFVAHCVNKETHFHQWQNATSAMNAPKHIAEELLKGRHSELPDLVPNRHVLAFRNGVYRMDHPDHPFGVFYDISSDTYVADTHDLVACNYIDSDFCSDFIEHPSASSDWYHDIPTPAFDGIFEYQRMDEDVKRWAYVMCGRMLYDLGEHDNWQVIVFCKGVAGSGKSTIGNILQRVYCKRDVGILSSNCEETFGLSAIHNKYIWMCLEVKEKFRLSQAEFQSMVSGEDVVIAIKNQTAISERWPSPGFLFGNEGGGWIEANNALGRRLLMLEFLRRVLDADSDPMLWQKLLRELPMLVLKWNIAYRAAASEFCNNNIWEVLPEYFRKTQKNMKKQIDSLQAFVASGDVVLGESESVPFRQFKKEFNAWIAENNYKRRRFNADFYASVFDEHGIRVDEEGDMLYGIGLAVGGVVGMSDDI